MTFGEYVNKNHIEVTDFQRSAARVLEGEGQVFTVHFGVDNCVEKAAAILNAVGERMYNEHQRYYPGSDYQKWVKNECPIDGGVFFMAEDILTCTCYKCGTVITSDEFVAINSQDQFNALIWEKYMWRIKYEHRA